MTIIIQEPAELDPRELVISVQKRFPNLRYADLAVALGVGHNTVARWMCGAKSPSKAQRILAARLAKDWGVA